MRQLALDAAYVTFVIQMYLFAIPTVASFVYLFRETILVPLEGFGKDDKNRPPRKADDLPELQPLNCPSCGAGVPLNESAMNCRHCGTEFPVPPEYEEIRTARTKTARTLRRAERYWRIVKVLTSKRAIVLALAAAVWLIVCLVVIIFAYGTPDIDRFTQVASPQIMPVATLVMWILMLLYIALSVSMTIRKRLPKIDNIGTAATEASGNCSNCGGAIRFERGDLAALCGYCGVATYRVKIAVRSAVEASNAADLSSALLTRQMRQFSASVEDYLSVPILFIVVPTGILGGLWLLLVVLALAFSLFVWVVTFVIVELIVHPIPTLIALAGLGALYYYRKSILGRLRSMTGRA